MTGPRVEPLTLEGVLSQQANEAMKAGADPRAVTERLGQMVQHIRAHPDFAKQGSDALAAGADPTAVAARVWQTVSGGDTAPVERPGLVSRVAEGVGNAVSNLVQHPASIITAPIASLTHAVLSPTIGDERPNPNLSKGGNSAHLTAQQIHTPFDAEHGGVTEKERLAGGLQTAANVAFPGVASGVASRVAAAGAPGMLAKALGLGAAGFGAGAASSPDDPLAGGFTGAILAPSLAGVGKAVGVAGQKVGTAMLDNVVGRPVESRPVLKAGPVRVGQIEGLRDRAHQTIADRQVMDQASGFTPPPRHPSLPPLALDQVGPNVEGLAEGIANRPGPGRAILQNAIESRGKRMRPAITRELEQGTGVSADAGLDPLRAKIAEKNATADEMYGAARAATEGQPMESPTLDQILQTPAGKLAMAWAKTQKANRNSTLPTVEVQGAIDADLLKQLTDQGVPHEKAVAALEEHVGTTTKEVPDPETLHYMKQRLAKLARLGVHDGQGGTIATAAHGALQQWAKIREELPPVWREADDATAAKFRELDAMNEGRNVFRASPNPAGRAGKAVATSLDAIPDKLEAMTEEARQAHQTGAAMGAHALLKEMPASVKSPGRVFANSPKRIEQLSHAFPSANAASDFQRAVSAWDAAQAQQQRILGNSRTGLRGAEGSGKGAVTPTTILGGSKAIIKAIIKSVGGAAREGNQQRLEAEVARILTAPDLKLLPPAQRIQTLQNRVFHAVHRGALVGAISGSGSQ